jgi:hypothetical protein
MKNATVLDDDQVERDRESRADEQRQNKIPDSEE